MSGAVWINGSFVERDEARVSAFDAGFTHGVGLFETMLALGERVVHAEQHVERLARSAKELGLSERVNAGALADALRLVAQRAGLPRARVRLTLTGGDLNMLEASAQAAHDPTVLISAQPAAVYPDTLFTKGAAVVIAQMRVNPLDPFSGHKTLSYWPRLRELQAAGAAGASEAVVLQVTNHLASGAVSNVFVVKDGALLTPIAHTEEEELGAELGSPVLPGVTRGFILDAAAEMGVRCERQMLDINDLLDADEVFLTNSSWGVLPVVKVEKEAIADAAPGELTGRLRERWRRAIEEGGS